jgi:protoporphyrinogen oxidase
VNTSPISNNGGIMPCSVAILGGGVAGLSVGYHLAKLGITSHVFEAESTVGGTCRTKEFAGLRFDMGAHRLHDVLPDVTREIRQLLGDDLSVVAAPSHIYHQGKRVLFPPTPLGLARALGFWKMAVSMVSHLTSKRREGNTFRDAAIARYGRLVAESFLINYTEKLWGVPAHRLSPEVSGKRLQGLDVRAALRSIVGVKCSEHLDGSFLYPRLGFGQITDALAAPIRHVHRQAKVETVFHTRDRITVIRLDDGRQIVPGTVVSTLPVSSLVRILDPAPDSTICDLAASLRFRSLRLAVLPVRAPSVTRSATLYFPSNDVPFTRIYEPKRRGSAMAPADRTCLVLEHPVFDGDPIDSLPREEFLGMSRKALLATGLVSDASLLDGSEQRIRDAYPVLDVGAVQRVAHVEAYLQRFGNLHRVGRAARFRYLHLHDLMREGRLLAETLAQRNAS